MIVLQDQSASTSVFEVFAACTSHLLPSTRCSTKCRFQFHFQFLLASTTSSRETSELSPSLTPLRVPQRPIRSMRTHTILEISKFSGSLDSVELTFQCVGTAWNFALSTVVIVVTIDQEPFPHDVKSLRPPEFSVPLLLNRQGCFISNSSWSLNDSWSGGFSTKSYHVD